MSPTVALLEAAGLAVTDVLPPAEGDRDRRFAIAATKSMSLQDSEVEDLRTELEAAAQSVGGTFDGWVAIPSSAPTGRV